MTNLRIVNWTLLGLVWLLAVLPNITSAGGEDLLAIDVLKNGKCQVSASVRGVWWYGLGVHFTMPAYRIHPNESEKTFISFKFKSTDPYSFTNPGDVSPIVHDPKWFLPENLQPKEPLLGRGTVLSFARLWRMQLAVGQKNMSSGNFFFDGYLTYPANLKSPLTAGEFDCGLIFRHSAILD